MFQGKKITKATLKSFVKKNIDSLYIEKKSEFNGMVDGVERCAGGFVKVERTDLHVENTLGVKGVWIVNGSRDYFTAYQGAGFVGIEVYNCCGSFVLAVKG